MGFRFSKRIKIMPGVKLNIGRRGVSTTIGVPGASVNIGKKGTYVNAGLPGTGISYREKIGGRTASGKSARTESPQAPPASSKADVFFGLVGLAAIIGLLVYIF